MASRNDVIVKMQEYLAANGQPATTKKDCELAFDAALHALEQVVMSEGTVRTAIGTFKKRETAARLARNPRTGESVEVAAKTMLAFKAAPSKTVSEAPAKAAKAPTKAKAVPAAAPAAKKVLKKKK